MPEFPFISATASSIEAYTALGRNVSVPKMVEWTVNPAVVAAV
jgi:hypothetical protein